MPEPPKSKPDVPVAIHCRCGKRIVLEPRWIGKPTACAGCQADFVVSMLVDPASKRWIPHVQYTPTWLPEKVKRSGNGGAWANVTCECGKKIGLDQRFIGKNMTCSKCGRDFIVRMIPRTRRHGDTAVLQVTREPLPPPVRPAGAAAPPPRTASPPPSPPPRSVGDLARSAPPPKKDAAAPPDEMHLLCTCGEELAVPATFYNRNMYCAGCGALMHLRLEFDAARSKYELLARVLDQPKEEPQP